MEVKRKTSDAVKILYKRYIDGNPEREKSLEAERINADVECMIYEFYKLAKKYGFVVPEEYK